TLNFAAVWRSFDDLLLGLALSLALAFGSILIGAVIGLCTAFGLISKNGLIKRPAGVYVSIIRNTPIL
ncbi:ABC transporter permease subunit, partial [Stenotrophomonas maltophilia]|uniref:ABC transporter permease subunit n=2 Tax=Pseudomonadota TaxID=1224 RepID=UPI0013DBA3F9